MGLYNINDNCQKNNISDFYKEANIFITGATGFLGKVLLEKLLRSCKSIGNIYILIRSKKGLNVDQRLKSLFQSPVFDKLREVMPKFSEKIKVVHGDVAQPNLGLSEANRRLIIEDVNIVFHVAAIVRFAGDIKYTVMLNTFGTKQIVELCKEIKQLKSFIYVSTAFSNANQKIVEEIVYDPPYDPSAIITCLQVLPSHILEKISEELIEKCPNPYVFSKALAESIVLQHSTSFPTAIVRPSIINGSWKEPFPGWVDGLGGAIGIVASGALGIVKNVWMGADIVADIIPVDIVTNTLVTAAWHTATTRSNTLKVYNCTVDHKKGVTWGQCLQMTQKYQREYPTQFLIGYPSYNLWENRKMYMISYFLFECTSAFMYDVFLYLTKRKPRVLDLCKKTAKNLKLVEFATFYQRNYDSRIFESLIKAVENAEDGDNFNIDMNKNNGFDWDDYVKACILGIRQYTLKDDLSSLNQARRKLKRIYWIDKIIAILPVVAMIAANTVISNFMNL